MKVCLLLVLRWGLPPFKEGAPLMELSSFDSCYWLASLSLPLAPILGGPFTIGALWLSSSESSLSSPAAKSSYSIAVNWIGSLAV